MIWVRRILGIVIILATLVVLVIMAAAAFYIGPALESASQGVDSGLALTVDTLQTVSATLEQTQSTLTAVSDSLDTASQTTVNLSKTVADTIPLLDQVSSVVSDQVPENIESMQSAIPNIAAVAAVVDRALVTLSNFGIKQTIPIPFNPIEIDLDLGIDYNPAEPFDQSIARLGSSLEGLPEELRALRAELEIAGDNLAILSEDLLLASRDVQTLSLELSKFIPLLDQYLELIDETIVAVEGLQEQLVANLELMKTVGTILPAALALTQLAPLVVGWQLLTSKPKPEEPEKETIAAAEVEYALQMEAQEAMEAVEEAAGTDAESEEKPEIEEGGEPG